MKQTVSRRVALLLRAAIAATGATAIAQALKPIKIVVPFPAGGTADILPRLVSDKLRSTCPGGVVVENKTGVGDNIKESEKWNKVIKSANVSLG